MRDAGLQQERTALAWSRTAMALAVNAIFLLRAIVSESEDLAIFGSWLLLVSSSLLMIISRRRAEMLAQECFMCCRSSTVAMASFSVFLAAFFGFLAIFMPHGAVI